MRLFVISMINRGLKRKTIQNHMANLFLLGREIIRDVSLYEKYDVLPAEARWGSTERPASKDARAT